MAGYTRGSPFGMSIPDPSEASSRPEDRWPKSAWGASLGMDYHPDRQPPSRTDQFPIGFKKSTMLQAKIKILQSSIRSEARARKQSENRLQGLRDQERALLGSSRSRGQLSC